MAIQYISQDYFDELVLENHEVFGGDKEDAVKETLVQLQHTELQHISCTFPNPTDRSHIQAFHTALEQRNAHIVMEYLNDAQRSMFRCLFLVQNGFEQFSKVEDGSQQHTKERLECLNAYCDITNQKSRSAYQASARHLIGNWMETYENTKLYWDICYKSIYRCEANKKLWMKQENFPNLLINALKSSSACIVLTCLCTFDDFESVDMLQSSHQNVHILATKETIDTLHEMMNSNDCVPAVQALRAIAVQEQVVIRMKSVLSTAVTLFTNGTDNIKLVTALLGLFRNSSANDLTKQALCSEHTMNSLHALGSLIRTNREAVEHGLAWIAAMALRNPQNASFLTSIHIPQTITVWMQEYPESVLVQRQGALALRNLASRASAEEKQALLSESKEPLVAAAARHLQCQDQIYAALRDMGASGVVESLVHVEALPDGKVRVRKAEHFGEGHNSNFRPVFD